MKKTLLMLFAILVYLSVKAQHINTDLISINEKYEFNLPQFDVCLPLPAKAEFCPPVLIGDEVLAEISNQTYYCFDLEYLKDPDLNNFKFKLSGKTTVLTLRIGQNEYNTANHEIILGEERNNDYFLAELTPLDTKLGKTISYQIEYNEEMYNIHALPYGDYVFLFMIESDAPEKEKKDYEKLIAGFKEKDLRHQRLKYENRLKYGYFDKEAKKIENPDPRTEYEVMEGKFDTETLLKFPLLNVSFRVPAYFSYSTKGRQMIDRGDNMKEVEMFELDILNETWVNVRIFDDNISLNFSRSKTDKYDVKQHIAEKKDIRNSIKKSKVVIDGIEMDAQLSGSEEVGDFDAVFSHNGYDYHFSIYDVNLESAPLADILLSNIQIDLDVPRKKKAGENPFTSVFSMKEFAPVELDELNLVKPHLSGSYGCLFEEIGLKVYFPGKKEDYVCYYGEIYKLPQEDIIKAYPTKDKPFSIFSMEGNMPVSCSFSINHLNRKKDMKEMMESMKKTWKTYPTHKVLKAGVVKIGDEELGVFMYETAGKYYGTISFSTAAYDFHYTVIADNLQDLEKYCGYVLVFSFE